MLAFTVKEIEGRVSVHGAAGQELWHAETKTDLIILLVNELAAENKLKVRAITVLTTRTAERNAAFLSIDRMFKPAVTKAAKLFRKLLDDVDGDTLSLLSAAHRAAIEELLGDRQ